MSSLASAPALDRKKYPCPTCHLSFRRSEHLSRHLLTHSGAKPFLCHICSRSFSRLDAVQRHVKTHLDSSKALSSDSSPASQSALVSAHIRKLPAPAPSKSSPASQRSLRPALPRTPSHSPEVALSSSADQVTSPVSSPQSSHYCLPFSTSASSPISPSSMCALPSQGSAAAGSHSLSHSHSAGICPLVARSLKHSLTLPRQSATSTLPDILVDSQRRQCYFRCPVPNCADLIRVSSSLYLDTLPAAHHTQLTLRSTHHPQQLQLQLDQVKQDLMALDQHIFDAHQLRSLCSRCNVVHIPSEYFRSNIELEVALANLDLSARPFSASPTSAPASASAPFAPLRAVSDPPECSLPLPPSRSSSPIQAYPSAPPSPTSMPSPPVKRHSTSMLEADPPTPTEALLSHEDWNEPAPKRFRNRIADLLV